MSVNYYFPDKLDHFSLLELYKKVCSLYKKYSKKYSEARCHEMVKQKFVEEEKTYKDPINNLNKRLFNHDKDTSFYFGYKVKLEKFKNNKILIKELTIIYNKELNDFFWSTVSTAKLNIYNELVPNTIKELYAHDANRIEFDINKYNPLTINNIVEFIVEFVASIERSLENFINNSR